MCQTSEAISSGWIKKSSGLSGQAFLVHSKSIAASIVMYATCIPLGLRKRAKDSVNIFWAAFVDAVPPKFALPLCADVLPVTIMRPYFF